MKSKKSSLVRGIKMSNGIVVTPDRDKTQVEKKVDECRKTCVNVGINFANQVKGSMVFFPINVRGIIPEHELVVPRSELAISEGAAGKKLLAWSIIDNQAHALYESEDCCRFIHGLPNEVLSKQVRELTRGKLE